MRIPHETDEDTIVPASMVPASQGPQAQAVNEATTALQNPDENEPEMFPLGTLPLEDLSLTALCLPKQNSPVSNVFTQLRSIAMAHTESHSQDITKLPGQQEMWGIGIKPCTPEAKCPRSFTGVARCSRRASRTCRQAYDHEFG